MAWNASDGARKQVMRIPQRKPRTALWISLMALGVVACVVLCLHLISDHTGDSVAPPVVVAVPSTNSVVCAVNTNSTRTAVEHQASATSRQPVRIERVNSKVTKKYYADGTWETSVSPYALKPGQVRRPNPFRSLLEKHLSKFAIPGDDDPILDEDFTDEEARKMLEYKIEISEDDDEEMVYRKNAVNTFKEELKIALNSGLSANEYLKELRKRQRYEAMMVRESRRMLADEIKNGTRESAIQLMDKLNANLESKGVRHMYLTKRMKEQLGIEHE